MREVARGAVCDEQPWRDELPKQHNIVPNQADGDNRIRLRHAPRRSAFHLNDIARSDVEA